MTHRNGSSLRHSLLHGFIMALATAIALGASAFAVAKAKGELEIRTLSTRPEAVTGGDVLIEVAIPARVHKADVRVFANETDVTSALRYNPDTRTLMGLVTGLRLGD